MSEIEGIRILQVSIHGLIRGSDLELGRNADTGGQTSYVVDLTSELGDCDGVARCVLLTRLIRDPEFSDDYARASEKLGAHAGILRAECGPDGYIRKEELYPHLDGFARNAILLLEAEGFRPDVVHGHYADGAYVAEKLAGHYSVPWLYTGHSMGRNKREVLLGSGVDPAELEQRYNLTHRIGIEENALRSADLVLASTRYEIETGYEGYDASGEANYRVVPPGIDLERFHPYYYDSDPGFNRPQEQIQAAGRMRDEISRFLTYPDKPLILAISRPDQRKNIDGLVTAYGRDRELQAVANLAVFAGVRRDIETMDDNEREVLTDLLLLMDRYDLYGLLALPKKHEPETDIPELYRMAAHSRGVFINPALVENFGITIIEAAACGLPVIATDFGGPVDIIANCDNGLLVDAKDEEAIRAALLRMLTDRDLWQRSSENGVAGVRKHYSWSNHCAIYPELLH